MQLLYFRSPAAVLAATTACVFHLHCAFLLLLPPPPLLLLLLLLIRSISICHQCV
jgi:hypothetical protein